MPDVCGLVEESIKVIRKEMQLITKSLLRLECCAGMSNGIGKKIMEVRMRC